MTKMAYNRQETKYLFHGYLPTPPTHAKIMTSPLIGLSSTRQLNRQGRPVISVAEAYTQAISQAGGLPVLIPLGLPEVALQGILSELDGLLFTGGGDIHPHQYAG